MLKYRKSRWRTLYLLPEVLTTAFFIRIIFQWINASISYTRKTFITSMNNFFIDIVQGMQIEKGGWLPLNAGFILTLTLIINLIDYVLQQKYDFFPNKSYHTGCLREFIFSDLTKSRFYASCTWSTESSKKYFSIAIYRDYR